MILTVFCKDTKMEYRDHLMALFRACTAVFTQENTDVLASVWDCVNAIVKVHSGQNQSAAEPTFLIMSLYTDSV